MGAAEFPLDVQHLFIVLRFPHGRFPISRIAMDAKGVNGSAVTLDGDFTLLEWHLRQPSITLEVRRGLVHRRLPPSQRDRHHRQPSIALEVRVAAESLPTARRGS